MGCILFALTKAMVSSRSHHPLFFGHRLQNTMQTLADTHPSHTPPKATESAQPTLIDEPAEFQYFSSHNTIVRFKVTHHRLTGLKYIFWSDLRNCFPGIARVQHGDTILTFLRSETEHRYRPLRIGYIPGVILKVMYEDSDSDYDINPIQEYSVQSKQPVVVQQSALKMTLTPPITDASQEVETHSTSSQEQEQEQEPTTSLWSLSSESGYEMVESSSANSVASTIEEETLSEPTNVVPSLPLPISDSPGITAASNALSNSEEADAATNTKPVSPLSVTKPTREHKAPQEKPSLEKVINTEAPPGSSEEEVAEFEAAKRDLIVAFRLLYAHLMASTDCRLLESIRRGKAMVRQMKELHRWIPVGHVLRHDFELLNQTVNEKKGELKNIWPHFLQRRVKQVTKAHFGMFEHMEPKMFVILPEVGEDATEFRLYFLCECCQATIPMTKEVKTTPTTINSDNKKQGQEASILPHRFHFAAHEGYELEFPDELIARFGYHMWTLLVMMRGGYEDNGVRVPPLEDARSPLMQRIQAAIEYIEDQPDSAHRDGTWEFDVVNDFLQEPFGRGYTVGGLYRIITEEHGYAKWICEEHFQERYPRNSLDDIQGQLNTFFSIEHLGVVLVGLETRRDASQLYEAIVKAENVQELGLELSFDVNENDIKMLMAMLRKIRAVSIKILVPFEHHIFNRPAPKDRSAHGLDLQNPDYALGHFKTGLIRQVIDTKRVQAFFLDVVDRSGHPDYQEPMDVSMRNLIPFEKWNPDRANPALCSMIRTAGPEAKTRLSFNSPTLERGFYFMNNAIRGDPGLMVLKAIVSSRESVTIRSGNDEARKSMRLTHWLSNTIKFGIKLERLWIDVTKPPEIKVLQQLIDLNPYLRKLRVTAKTSAFYKIYEAVKQTVLETHSVPIKFVLWDEGTIYLKWSNLVDSKATLVTSTGAKIPPAPSELSLSYGPKAKGVNTVLMLFGFMLTTLECTDLSNEDVQTLEACTRSRRSKLSAIQANLLGLNKKGLEDLGKVLDRTPHFCIETGTESVTAAVEMIMTFYPEEDTPKNPAKAPYFGIHLSPMQGIRPDWDSVADFLVAKGKLINAFTFRTESCTSQDVVGIESFLKRVTSEVLPSVKSLVISGSGPVESFESLSAGANAFLSTIMSSSLMAAIIPNKASGPNPLNEKAWAHLKPGYKPKEGEDSTEGQPSRPLGATTTAAQISEEYFLSWVEDLVSSLRLERLRFDHVLLETEDWQSLLKKVDFSKLTVLDLEGCQMDRELVLSLPEYIPMTPLAPHLATMLIQVSSEEPLKALWARLSPPSEMARTLLSGVEIANEYLADSVKAKKRNMLRMEAMRKDEERRRREAAAKKLIEGSLDAEQKEDETCSGSGLEDSVPVTVSTRVTSNAEEIQEDDGQGDQGDEIHKLNQRLPLDRACVLKLVKMPTINTMTGNGYLERSQMAFTRHRIREKVVGCEVE